MKYIYTAEFDIEPGKVYARVPDLPGCITTGSSLEDAIEQITDAASIWLVCAEDNEDNIPSATAQADLKHEDNMAYSFIQIDTLAYRALIDNRSVRKNVSLPAWMANMAEKRGINCSQVLQEGLKVRLSN